MQDKQTVMHGELERPCQVTVTMAWPLAMEGGKILNKQLQTLSKGWSSSPGGRQLLNIKTSLFQSVTQVLKLGQALMNWVP
jgi:hypothetical protein